MGVVVHVFTGERRTCCLFHVVLEALSSRMALCLFSKGSPLKFLFIVIRFLDMILFHMWVQMENDWIELYISFSGFVFEVKLY